MHLKIIKTAGLQGCIVIDISRITFLFIDVAASTEGHRQVSLTLSGLERVTKGFSVCLEVFTFAHVTRVVDLY